MIAVEDRRVDPASVSPEPPLRDCASAHAPALRRYFARRAPPADVDDLVQDVFVRLQSARPREPVIDPAAYLFTVARHVLASRRRRLARQGWGLHDAIEDTAELASDLSPERILGARQDWARVMAAVDDLPPRARAAFRMHRFEELSYAGIAERMGISRESVKELLHRASRRIGGIFDKNGAPHPPGRGIQASLDAGMAITRPRRDSRHHH